jgi:intracellular multiplication protein IcmB
MDWLSKILMSIDAIKAQWLHYNKNHADDYYELITAVNDTTLKANDGTMVSIFSLKGFARLLSDKEKKVVAKTIADGLQGYFTDPGVSLQIVDCSDPELTQRKVVKSMTPSINELKAIGLNSPMFTDDYIRFVAKNAVWKEQYLVVTTQGFAKSSDGTTNDDHLDEETKAEVKAEKSAKEKIIKHVLKKSPSEQGIFLSDDEKELLALHKNYVKTVQGKMVDAGALITKLNVSEALVAQKEAIYGKDSPDSWKPTLGNFHVERSAQSPTTDGVKLAESSLVEQVLSEGGTEKNMPVDIFQFGRRYFSTVSMVIPQSSPDMMKSYEFILTQIPRQIGYMASYKIDSDPFGTRAYKIEKVYTSMGTILPFTDNGLIRDARLEIENRHKERVELSVSLQVTFTLYSNTIEKLISNKRFLMGKLADWGGAQFRTVEMDKTQGLFSSVPGVARTAHFKQVFESFSDALYQSPIFMDSVPYTSGYLHFFTAMGLPFPFEEHSSRNINYNTYTCGESGSGKSTLLSLLNLALMAKPKANPKLSGEMPLIMNVDFGKTSFGLNDTVRRVVDQKRKHWFLSHEMTDDKESAYNVHDLPFGRTAPTMRHKGVLVRFLTVLLCGIDETKGGYKVRHDEIESMIKYLVDVVYEYRSDDHEPHMYENSYFKHPKTLAFMKSIGIDANPRKSYYMLSDEIMEKAPKEGLRHAMLIRRYAMPRLSDYSEVLSARPEITEQYKQNKLRNGSTWYTFFLRRLGEVINEYPCFNRVTKINLDWARMISIDIKNVCGDSTSRKAIFGSLMLLMFLVKKENIEESPDLLKDVDKLYIPYLTYLNQMNLHLPAALNIEEAHVLQALFENVLNENQRQNRKANWGLRTFSQRLMDPSSEFFSLCSTIFVTSNEANPANNARFAEMGLSMRERDVVKTELSNSITELFAYVRTKNAGGAKIPRIAVKLKALFPGGFIWSSNSDQTDSMFRNAVVDEFGFDEAIKLLVSYCPAGKVKHYFESDSMRELATNQGHESVMAMFLSEMANSPRPSDKLARML